MMNLRQFFPVLLLLGAAVAGLGAETPAPPRGTAVRVVSQTVGTDELLLALAAPEQVAACPQSHTGTALAGVLEDKHGAA